MTDNDRPDLAAIRARLKAYQYADKHWGEALDQCAARDYKDHNANNVERQSYAELEDTHKALIAAAPSDIAALVRYVERLEAALREIFAKAQGDGHATESAENRLTDIWEIAGDILVRR